jgi:solute carrier family 8 (sodium/calcium exchanger)
LSIIAVGEEPKKIYDTSVFAVTSIASIFAYVWLYVTLDVISREYVEVWEAWLTLLYFVVLIVVSFAADKATAFMEEKKKT